VSPDDVSFANLHARPGGSIMVHRSVTRRIRPGRDKRGVFVDPHSDRSPRRPLAVGLLLPDHERQFDGATARWPDLREMARIGEEIGADSIWVTDHLIHRAADTEPRGSWECWSHLSALAAVTTRAQLGTLVV